MATFVALRYPVIILVTDFTDPNNFTNDILIINFFIIKKSLALRQCNNTGNIKCLHHCHCTN